MTRGSGDALAAAGSAVAAGLERVAAELAAAGMPIPAWEGKRIRPLVGWAAARSGPRESRGSPSDVRLWRALASVQLAHEASLLHDDVIDSAPMRRGAPTMVEARGVGAALVEGDHLLTAAYRLAAGTGSLAWVELFARAVERTVAGEKAQARSAGRVLDWDQYEQIVLGKSGELLGAALAASAVLSGDSAAARLYHLGRRLGLVYQMLDDLLDYCPAADAGKAPLADHARGLWTWPLAFVDAPAGTPAEEVVRRLGHRGADGQTPAARALTRLREEARRVAASAGQLLPGDAVIGELLGVWTERAERAAAALETGLESEGGSAAKHDAGSPTRGALPPVDRWERLLREHARSFNFAARLFPRARRRQVMGVYAWCRYTDELVDDPALPADEAEARLDAWLELSRGAYEGEPTGNPLADRVMGEMRSAAVPFGYAAELIEGMRMDVRGEAYATPADLRLYTYRVASVVGLWLCELFDIRDPWMLQRAVALGHAMQLTNIARDIGEDLRRGRVYIPDTWLAEHDLTPAALRRMAEDGHLDDRFRAVVRRVVEEAEAQYELAAPAVALLPGFFRRPVAVAAAVYRGIHAAIARNGFDTLTHRAYTTRPEKVRLGAGALWRLMIARPRLCPCGRLAAAAAGLVALALLTAVGVAAQSPASPRMRPTADAVVAAPALRGAVAPLGASTTGADSALSALRRLWTLGADEESAVDAGLEEVASLRARRRPAPSSRLDLLLRAYEGSFTALRAKHGTWPPARLRALRRGLALMDAAVEADPDAAVLRHIRLMSGFHLPGIFGRKGEVADDMAALIRLLPSQAADFPPDVLPGVVAFVLEHGEPAPAARRDLEALLPAR